MVRANWMARSLALIAVSFTLVASACDSGGEDPSDAADVADTTAQDVVEVDMADPCENVDPGVCTDRDIAAVCDGATSIECGVDDNGCLVEAATNDCASVPFGTCDTDSGVCIVNDPCEGVSDCETEGQTCDGDDVVFCQPDAFGCLVESRESCGGNGLTCLPASGDDGEDACGFDPCTAVDAPCTTAGRSCNGDTLVVCEQNSYSCLAETEIDCAATGGTCDDSGEMPLCTKRTASECTDACAMEGRTCIDDSTLQTCRRDRFGCLELVESRCNQVQTGVGYCQSGAEGAMCELTLDTSCDQFTTCPTEGSTCTGDTLVECRTNVFGCIVETQTDCSQLGAPCEPNNGAASCGDPCDQVQECNVDSFCQGNELVTCAQNAFGCLVPDTTVDCAASDQLCVDSTGTPECSDQPASVSASGSPSLTIPDGGNNVVTTTLEITQPCTVTSMEVQMNIQHSYIGDLTITLQSPSGTQITLHDRSGGGSSNIIGVYPNDLAPADSLSAFTGEGAMGVWTLGASDAVSIDGGSIQSWGLDIMCQQ